jgi:hypothetical protein
MPLPHPGSVPLSPRVEIAPGIFAESVVKRAESGASEPYQVYEVTGGVFDHLELDSMSALTDLVGLLSSLDADDLRTEVDVAVQEVPAARHRPGRRSGLDGGHRRVELELPSPAGSAAAHRRFACDGEAPRRARIWLAETLGDCLPDAEWSVPMLEQAVLQVSGLVEESVESGASAILVTLEVEGRRLSMTRFDEYQGGAAGG